MRRMAPRAQGDHNGLPVDEKWALGVTKRELLFPFVWVVREYGQMGREVRERGRFRRRGIMIFAS